MPNVYMYMYIYAHRARVTFAARRKGRDGSSSWRAQATRSSPLERLVRSRRANGAARGACVGLLAASGARRTRAWAIRKRAFMLVQR